MTPQISIVIETENIKGQGRGRALEMMDALRPQIQDRDDLEIVLVFDETAASPGDVEALVEDGGLKSLGIPIEFIRSGAVGYYESKNLGSRSASGDTLVFLDSDVIPEPGWLDVLLATLEHPEVDIAAGSAYLGPLRSLVDRVFAAIWFFPIRMDEELLREAPSVFVNNMAVRRDFFLAHPFPHHDELNRGQCVMWSKQIRAEDKKLWRNSAARVAHPPPGSIFKSGLSRGHDRYVRGHEAGLLRGGALLSSLRMFAFEMNRSSRRIFQRRKTIGLSWPLVPAAFGVALYYWTAEWLGFVTEWLRPGWIRRHRQPVTWRSS